jgi:cytochrome P450
MDGNYRAPQAASPLDMSAFKSSSMIKELLASIVLRIGKSRWFMSLMRRFFPILRWPGKDVFFVFRADDVAEVLSRDHVFEVSVTGERVKKVDNGRNFLLGLPDDARCPVQGHASEVEHGYRDYQKLVMHAFRIEDVSQRVVPIAEDHVRGVLDRQTHEIDAIADLVTGVPIAICCEYIGVPIADPVEFSHWTFAISRYLFDPSDGKAFEAVAIEGSQRLNAAIDDAMLRAVPNNPRPTVLERLMASEVPRDKIRVIVSGMIIGFVPTSTMAGAHILEQLLDRPEFLARARQAAEQGDLDLLKRCLFEAMRFDPLDREPLRTCTCDCAIAAGTSRERALKKGDRVIVVTRSAMMDPARVPDPGVFDAARPQSQSMVFGYGLHRCIGAPLAEAQITHTFRALVQKQSLRRSYGPGKQQLGPFATNLNVSYD